VLDWLKKTRRIEINPIELVGRVDGCGKQSFKRRAYTDNEAQRLLAVNENRRPIYLLALHTGLRLGELRALRWDDIATDRPLIRLRAETTKARRADVLPITVTAQAILGTWRQTCPSVGLVFPKGVPSHHTFRADLEAACIDRKDQRGHKVDFHALRTTFITNLARVGVPQRQAMALARHTDPRLTANIYTDQDALPLAEAVAKLPTYGIVPAADNAHGRSHELVSESPNVSQTVIEVNEHKWLESTGNTEPSGVNVCLAVTHKDTKQQWSRGESNPRESWAHCGAGQHDSLIDSPETQHLTSTPYITNQYGPPELLPPRLVEAWSCFSMASRRRLVAIAEGLLFDQEGGG